MTNTLLDRRVTPFRSDLAAQNLRGLVEAARYVPGATMRVAWPSAPLRRRPASDAPLDTEALRGEAVTVYDEEEGWAWGQLETDGYVGYLPSEALASGLPEPTHRVAVLRSFVYPGPDLKLPPLEHLSLCAGVTVASVEGDYARLATGAAVFARHLVPIESAEPDFVAVAERFVGTPYLWGGKTSLGLDCSGLVQVSLGAAGIPAPRDSDMLSTIGEAVELRPDFSGLQRGDLVFWKGHMGVMLDAARLLHANGHHMLTAIEPLATAEERIRRNSYGPITGIRRLEALGAKPAR
jgi:cell wall-associated NlpC family hydrolase